MRNGCKNAKGCVRIATFSHEIQVLNVRDSSERDSAMVMNGHTHDKVMAAPLLLGTGRLGCGNYATLSLDLWVQNSMWQKARVNVSVVYRDTGSIKAGRHVLYTLNCNKSLTLVPGSDNPSFWGFSWTPTKTRLSFIHYLQLTLSQTPDLKFADSD